MVIKINGNVEMELKSGFHLFFSPCASAFHMLQQNSFTGTSSKFQSLTSGHSNWWKTLLAIPFEMCNSIFFLPSLFLSPSHCCWPSFQVFQWRNHYSCIDLCTGICPRGATEMNEYAKTEHSNLPEDKRKNANGEKKKRAFNLKTLQY